MRAPPSSSSTSSLASRRSDSSGSPQRGWWAVLGRGVERLAPNNNGDVAAASGGGRWCVSVRDHHQGPAVPTRFCNAGCPKGYVNNILGVIVPAMKLVGLDGPCMGIAQRPHGQHQRSGRIVVGLCLFTLGLCLVVGPAQEERARLVRAHWTRVNRPGQRQCQGRKELTMVKRRTTALELSLSPYGLAHQSIDHGSHPGTIAKRNFGIKF